MTAAPPDSMPAEVAQVFAAFPGPVRARLAHLRGLILDVAVTADAGPLTESLKWGEPAYRGQSARRGTTIRLGWPRTDPDHVAIYVNCRTTLVTTWRAMFPDSLTFAGNRAILLPVAEPIPQDAVAQCIAMALTYDR
jgi:hypothetical protein